MRQQACARYFAVARDGAHMRHRRGYAATATPARRGTARQMIARVAMMPWRASEVGMLDMQRSGARCHAAPRGAAKRRYGDMLTPDIIRAGLEKHKIAEAMVRPA